MRDHPLHYSCLHVQRAKILLTMMFILSETGGNLLQFCGMGRSGIFSISVDACSGGFSTCCQVMEFSRCAAADRPAGPLFLQLCHREVRR